MSSVKRAFIAKELLNFPDCVSQIMKVLQMDFVGLQKLCYKYHIKIDSERNRLGRHDLMKLKQPLIDRLNELSAPEKIKTNPIHFNSHQKNKKPNMSHGPIFDQMANQKNKIQLISTPMRD